MQYRRFRVQGGVFFFTVVTYNRRAFLQEPARVELLRQSFRSVMHEYPFTIDAAVILPDHLHCIWTLPEGDSDYSLRWRPIKSYFSRRCDPGCHGVVSASRATKHEQAVWQRRFWEHTIRDAADFNRHVDYIHYNPVKHRLVRAPKDWPYSTFVRYVQAGIYAPDWSANVELSFGVSAGYE